MLDAPATIAAPTASTPNPAATESHTGAPATATATPATVEATFTAVSELLAPTSVAAILGSLAANPLEMATRVRTPPTARFITKFAAGATGSACEYARCC